jgi:predicted nicotinamide N-methyase
LNHNANANPVEGCTIRVEAYDWGTENAAGAAFDVILGGDLAYNPGLYAPLINVLLKNSDEHTLIFLGVTRSDTERGFYLLLRQAGFEYYRIPDRELEGKCDAGAVTNFGIFIIFRARDKFD